jgi:hypothetical protein
MHFRRWVLEIESGCSHRRRALDASPLRARLDFRVHVAPAGISNVLTPWRSRCGPWTCCGPSALDFFFRRPCSGSVQRQAGATRPSTAGACSWPPGRFPSPDMPLSFYMSCHIVRPPPTAHPPSTWFARTRAVPHRAELLLATTRRCCRRPSQIPVELAALLRSLYS